MKRILIEQVDNGYIVTNKPERGEDCTILLGRDTGIRAFESFASMSKWLEGHFAREDEQAFRPGHLGTDET